MNFNQSNTSQPNTQDQLKCMFYPESLEDSKILPTLNEELKFKIDNLLAIKEVQKPANNSREDLCSLIKQLDFISESEGMYQINISEDFCLFSLINIPNCIKNKLDLSSALNIIDIDSISRIYKKNLFVWYLVVEKREGKEKLEKSLKNVNFGDEKLKYECYTKNIIKKNINKRIQNIIYSKESCGLKANSNNNSNSASSSNENYNWRKKSNENNDELSFKKGSKNVSNFDNNLNSFKRRRFNSDTGGDNDNNNVGVDNQDIKAKVNISENENIKFRYSFKQFLDIFNNLGNYLSIPPTFVTNIEDMCNKEKKLNFILSGNKMDEKRDRSRTFNYDENDLSNLLFENKK